MGITGIRIEGFKCFRDATELEIRPLTVLAGRNSTGKSSLLQPLLLLKQTLEAPHDSDPLLLNGSCVKVLDSADLFWTPQRKQDGSKTWSIEIQTGSDWVTNTYSRRGGRFHIESTRGVDWEAHADGRFTPHNPQSHLHLGEGWDGSKIFVRPVRAGLELVADIKTTSGRSHVPLYELDAKPFLEAIHLPGLRGRPERFYPVTRVGSLFSGQFPAYTASVLAAWQDAQDARVLGVGEDLRTLGLTWRVHAQRLDDSRVELRVGRLPKPRRGGSQDLVNIADVGIGASQVLPVVVALRVAKAGQLVHIEQPELHLHPDAQVAMAKLLVNAAKRGARVVVETHSSVMLKALQLAVATGELDEDLLALHWFSRDQDGATLVNTANIDSSGIYGDWPVDFSAVEMDVEARFIEAATA